MEPLPFYQMRPAYLEGLNTGPRGWPKRDRFCCFFRDAKGYRGEPERYWGRLKLGRPVPEVIARAFAEYLGEHWGVEQATLDAVFWEAASPKKGVWESPQAILDALTEHLTDCDEMYIRDHEADCALAARMLMNTVGSKTAGPDEPLDEEACVRRAERVMDRSVEEYGRWLGDLARGDGLSRTVMFVVSGGERIGATVVIPLNEGTFQRVCTGQIHDKYINRGDLQMPSRHLFIHNMSDAEGAGRITAREKTLAQARNIYYQVAYFTRQLRPLRPAAVSLVTNPHYGEILRGLGFVETGSTMHGTSFPIATLRHPRETNDLSVRAWVPYGLLTLTLRVFRMANSRQWGREDRRLRRDPI